MANGDFDLDALFAPRNRDEAVLRVLRGVSTGEAGSMGAGFASPQEAAGLIRSTASAEPPKIKIGGVIRNSPELYKPENFSADAQARAQAQADAENLALMNGGVAANLHDSLAISLKDRNRDNENLELFSAGQEELQKIADSGSMLDMAKDAGYRATAGMNSMFGDAYQFGADMAKEGKLHDVLSGWAKAARDEAELNRSNVSLATQAQDQLLNAVVDDPDKGALDVAKAAVANPRATTGMVADSFVPTFLPMITGAGAAKMGLKLGMSAPAAISLGTRIPVLSEAAQNFMQTANETEGDRGQKLFSGGIAGLTTALAGKLTDAGMAGDLVRRVVGYAPKSGVLPKAWAIFKTSGKEAAEEYLQNWGQAVAPYMAKFSLSDLDRDKLQQINNQSVMSGIVGAASAAGPSVVSNIGGRRNGAASAKGQASAGSAIDVLNKMAGDQAAQAQPPAGTANPPQMLRMAGVPMAAEKKAAPQAAAKDKIEFKPEESEAKTGEVVLQNRDRSTPASVQQMNSIAAHPDYARVSASRDFGNGAPVVAYGSVPEAQLGREDVAVTADGERIPVQYAVVEGDTILTSNNLAGQPNQDYASAPSDRMRAIAGNGRVAGITAAYGRGTASGYKAEMMADTASHGIAPEVIEGMKRPILVRVMPQEKIRPDIGDISNTSGNLQMSAAETAKNDVSRLDFNALQFDENGEPSLATVRGFVSQMPPSEQGALLDTDGRPTRAAQERFTAALFKKAYGSEDLSRLQAQAVDPEIRNIFRAMISVAGRMSRLEGAGDLDIRSLVTRAAIQAVNARREGVKLEDYARQAGMFGTGDAATDAGIAALVDVFAKNSRSAKEMARILDAAAAFAYSEANKPAVDMFGETQRATRQDVADLISKENADEPQQDFFGEEQQQAGPESGQAEGRDEREGQADLVEPAGAESAREDVQREGDRAAADGRGQADIGEAEGAGELKFSRSSGLAAAREKISAFLERIRGRVFNSKGRESFEDYMPVSDSFADRVQELTGIDVHGFTHSIVDDNVRHAMNRHGAGNESSQEQVPLTEADLLLLPEIIGRPDAIRSAGISTLGGQPIIAIEKQMADGTTFVVEEIRKGRRKLMFLTAYKKNRPMLDVARKSPPRTTPEANRAHSSAEEAGRPTLDVARKSPPSITSETLRAHPSSDQSIEESRQTGSEGQTRSAEDVRDSLRSDSVVGDAFAKLERAGTVVVVSSVSELPENVRAAMGAAGVAESRAAKVSKETRFQNALKKLEDALRNRTSAHRVAYNDSLGGWIDVDWGKLGEIIDALTLKTKGAMGLSHIIDKRSVQASLPPADVAAILRKMARTLVEGELARKSGGQVLLRLGRFTVGLGVRGGNRYVITAVGSYKAEAAPSGQLSAAAPLPATLQARNDLSPGTRSRNVSAISENIVDNGLLFKSEEGGATQAVYDPVSGKAYFIAGNIKAGDEKGVFLHEVGVHMAADQGAAEQMAPLIRRAQQIVQNGSRNGDPLAQRVHQRLEDAGLLDENGRIKKGFEDEAYAYLAEEFANDPERASHPVREWFRNLASRVKAWLYSHGLRSLADHLSDRDLATLTAANARAMADTKGRSRPAGENPGAPKFSHAGRNQEELYPNSKEQITLDQVQDEIQANARDAAAVVPSMRVTDAISTLKGLPARAFNSLKHPVRRDELGKLEFGPGRDFARALGNATTTVLDESIKKLDSVTVNTLGIAKGPIAAAYTFKAAPKNVRIAIRRMKASEWQAFQRAEELAENMAGWDSNKRLLLSDVVEKELAAGTNAPEDVVAVADKMSHIMNQQSEELVELGMLSRESQMRWRDVYLPRFYKRATDIVSFFRGGYRKSAAGGIKGSHLKMRGNLEAVPVQEFERKIAMGYELRDPLFELRSDEAAKDTGDLAEPSEGSSRFGRLVRKDGRAIRQDDVVHVWRDWTREERQDMGEIRDGLYRFVVGYTQIQHDLALGRLFASLAENKEICRNTPLPGYTQVPDTAVPESGVKRYGKLSGLYLRDDVFATVFPLAETSSTLAKIYKKCLGYWKEGKTAMNPVSHMNNIIGNFMFAHLAGLPLYRLDTWADAVRMIRGKGGKELQQFMEEGLAEGLLTGSFTQAELDKMLPPELQELANQSKAAPEAAMDALFNILTLGLRKHLGKAYEFEDVFFKVAIYLHARRAGLNAAESVDYALRFIPTYDDLPGGARALKNSVFPFFSWTYKAVPVMISQALAHPLRAAAVFGMAHVVNLYMYAMAAGDDDDDWWTKIQKGVSLYGLEQEMLPEYMQGYGLFGNPKFVRLWVDQGTGLPQFWNVSNAIPGGQFWDATNQSGGVPWPEMLTVGNPIWTIGLGLGQNRDTFTGRQVWEDYDSDMDKLYKGGSFLWRNIAPAVAPYNYHWDRLADAVAHTIGQPVNLGVHEYTGIGRAGQAQTMPSALLNTAGIKVRDVDFQREARSKINNLSYQNREIKAQIRRLQRQAGVGSITMAQAKKEVAKKLDQLRENNEKIATVIDMYRLRGVTLEKAKAEGEGQEDTPE